MFAAVFLCDFDAAAIFAATTAIIIIFATAAAATSTSTELMCTHDTCDPRHVHVVSTACTHGVSGVYMSWVHVVENNLCRGSRVVGNNVNVTHTMCTWCG